MAQPANVEIARIVGELAQLTKLEDGSPQSFRVRAYEKAEQALRDLGTPAAEMTEAELVAVDGIGKSIAAKIREYVDTGAIAKLDELRAAYPPEFVALTRIPGLGPKTLVLIRDELGVADLAGLREAVEQERLRDLPGLGAKTEENVARAIERLGLAGKEHRTPVGVALQVAEEIVAELAEVPGVDQAQYCGSLRRFRDTVADVDVVVAATAAEPVMDRFVGLSLAAEVAASGDTKSVIRTRDGLQVDLRVVAPDQFGAATLYFTGSKDHNIELRQRALGKGWTLNEYALSDAETGDVIAAADEAGIYAALGLGYVPPTLREARGEVALAAGGELPAVVGLADLKGDLHVHSTLSGDGRSPLEAMVAAGAARGLEYMAFTEHGEDLAINGVDRDGMRARRAELAELGERYPGTRLLFGCELNIGPDGSLDYDEDFRLEFDWCVASVHSYFDLPADHQTARLVAAMQDPAVGAIGHLSGRKIGRRPGIEFDVDLVLAAAAASGTAIEINGAIDRLDATEEVLWAARHHDVHFTVSTDSHHVDEFRRAEWGVLHAQRAWVDAARVVNTWPADRFLAWVASQRAR